MKAIHFLITSIIITIPFTGNCQIDDINNFNKTELESVRKNFKKINTTKSWSKINIIDIDDVSTEGAQAKFYYNKDELKKIIVVYYGETGKKLIEFYTKNGTLSFVFEKDYAYNRPIYYNSTQRKENNDTENFDIKKSRITEIKSYFYKGNLIKQVNSERKASKTSFLTEQIRILTHFKKLKNKVK